MKRWRIHACWRDEECQRFGAPKRLYVFTPLGSIIVGTRTQLWVPVWGSTMIWSPIVYHPNRNRRRPSLFYPHKKFNFQTNKWEQWRWR